MEAVITPLKRLIDRTERGDGSMEELQARLLSFACREEGFDEERFLHEKAIEFERRDRARTFLVSTREHHLLGFFSLAMEPLEIHGVNPSVRKKITAGNKNADRCAAFLIGQLAKSKDCEKGFGSFLLDSAVSCLRHAQSRVGGRVIYLECKDISSL